MELLKTIKSAHEYVWSARMAGRSVGLVPTMGALHRGHLSLVEASEAVCDKTVATIFVNPTQFGPEEDLARYPRTLESDLKGLEDAGAAAVFLPDNQMMYPSGFSTSIRTPDVASVLEGVYRPEHFSGVATVVMKLFQILPASHAFFGQKDYQQFAVIQSMVRDLNVAIELVSCPIIRETDGLAMSSRNRYLSDDERTRAVLLSQSLEAAQGMVDDGVTQVLEIEERMRGILQPLEPGAGVDEIDYAVVVNPSTLGPVSDLRLGSIALIAARVGSTRLIDNRVLTVTH